MMDLCRSETVAWIAAISLNVLVLLTVPPALAYASTLGLAAVWVRTLDRAARR